MEKHIYGNLLQPLEIGEPAYIQVSQGTMRTSTVQHFIEMPDGTTRIITKNSVYVLHG